MALGDPVVGGTNLQATLFFGTGKSGWTETYFMNVNGSDVPLNTGESAMRRIIDARRPLLPTDVSCEALRVSRIDKRGDSNLIFPPDQNLGAGDETTPTSNPVNGWLVRIENDDFQVTDSRIYRGWSPSLATWFSGAPVGAPAPARVVAFVTKMRSILTNVFVAPTTGASVKFCLRSYDRTDANYPLFAVFPITVSAAGRLVVRAITSTIGSGTAIGKTLILSVPRKKCLRGVSGRHRIIDMTTVGGTQTDITLDKRLCCSADELVGLDGQARTLKPALFAIAYCYINRLAKRDVGRAFFAPRGRRSARCC